VKAEGEKADADVAARARIAVTDKNFIVLF
jgi:hypothetical protein